MPQNKSNEPKVMSWGKAVPILAIAGVFDALRFFFNQFWLFGPLLAGTAVATFLGGYIGSTLGSAVGAAATIGIGVFGAPVLAAFGIFCAMAVGLLGWLTVGLALVLLNPQIFKANKYSALWMGASLAVAEVPLIGSIPSLTGVLVHLYRSQIRSERAAHAAWKEEQRKREHDRRNQEAVLLLEEELRAMQEQEEVELQAANDNEEIPDDERKAA